MVWLDCLSIAETAFASTDIPSLATVRHSQFACIFSIVLPFISKCKNYFSPQKESSTIEAKTIIYSGRKRGAKCDGGEADHISSRPGSLHHPKSQQHEGRTFLNEMFRLLLMVALYYPLSVGLTFYQKWFIKSYRLPLLIVAGHYATKYLLAIGIRSIVEWVQKNRRLRVPLQEQLRWIMPIGFCASLDIGLSNWSLEYVTVSLYTMAKSSSILFIVGFSLLLKLERWHTSLGMSAFLIAFGLFLFTWQSTQLDLRGLLLVELAALCTGVRWTISQVIMQGEDCSTPVRHPLDMMIAVQPWMLLAIVPIVVVVEGPELTFQQVTSFHGEFQPGHVLMLVLIGGILAFLMEFAEYLLLVNTSGITLSILGIVKEGISLLLAHHIHGDHLSNVNIAGLVLCVVGMVLHSVNKHRHGLRQRERSASILGSPSGRKESLSASVHSHSRCGSDSSPSPLIGRRNGGGKNSMVELEDRRKLLVPEQTTI